MKRNLLSLSLGATTMPRATISWPVPKVQVYQGRYKVLPFNRTPVEPPQKLTIELIRKTVAELKEPQPLHVCFSRDEIAAFLNDPVMREAL